MKKSSVNSVASLLTTVLTGGDPLIFTGSITIPSDAAKKAREVDADKMADTLASDLDHYKQMKIHEERLVKQLKSIREAKDRLKARLLKNID